MLHGKKSTPFASSSSFMELRCGGAGEASGSHLQLFKYSFSLPHTRTHTPLRRSKGRRGECRQFTLVALGEESPWRPYQLRAPQLREPAREVVLLLRLARRRHLLKKHTRKKKITQQQHSQSQSQDTNALSLHHHSPFFCHFFASASIFLENERLRQKMKE